MFEFKIDKKFLPHKSWGQKGKLIINEDKVPKPKDEQEDIKNLKKVDGHSDPLVRKNK